jgi:hypothetical protein
MTSGETEARVRRPRAEELEVEQDVDVSRYWLALVQRWWLVVIGLVLGALIGFAATSTARPYRSDIVLYLGQPLFGTGDQPIQTVATNFQFVTQLLTSSALVDRVAGEVGTEPDRLRPAISIAAFTPEGPARQGTAARIATISVTGFAPAQGKDAATRLAQAVIARTKGYVGVKLSVYQARLTRADRELALIQKREDAATAAQDALVHNTAVTGAEKLLLLAHYDNIFNANEARRTTIESSQLALRDQVALAQQVELPRVLEPAIAVRVAAPSRRSHLAVGALIGVVLGILAALLWNPVGSRVRRRRA